MPVTQLESWISLQIDLPRKTVLSRTALRRWQLARLRGTVDLARTHSPWYHQHLQNTVLPATDDPAVLVQTLPFTTAEDIRTHGPEMLCCSQAAIARIITLESSGTSAAPKRVFFTADDLKATKGFFQYGMRLVVGPDDRVLVLLPCQRDNDVGNLLVAALSEGGIASRAHWPVHDPEVLARAVHEYKAHCLVGLPQHILALARHPRADLAAAHLKSVLLCSDYTDPCVREAIAAGLSCRVHIHYGSTESGLGAAVECKEGQGCHIRENDLFFEIIDPGTGAVLPPDTEGEIVFTTLTRTGMPLLRYRTGDIGRLNRQRCSCGSILTRLKDLQGRLENSITFPGQGTLTLAALDQALFTLPAITSYEAAVEDPPDATPESPPRLALKLVLRPGSQHTGEDLARQALLTVPVLGQTVLAGQLTLDISTTEVPFERPHTAKRSLSDNRHLSQREYHAQRS